MVTETDEQRFSLWEALKQGAPGLALVPLAEPLPPGTTYDNFPGFLDWLLAEYALGWPSKRIKAHLDEIRAAQKADLVVPWPELGKRDIDWHRNTHRALWVPLRDQLSAQIENVGVLAKNERLLALARTAEELETLMWEERNSRTGELYLLEQYRQTLRQVAEEKGELGEGGAPADNTLLKIAEMLAGAIKVQGSGVQPQVIEGEWAYEEGDEAAELHRESEPVEANGVSAKPCPDPVPQEHE